MTAALTFNVYVCMCKHSWISILRLFTLHFDIWGPKHWPVLPVHNHSHKLWSCVWKLYHHSCDLISEEMIRIHLFHSKLKLLATLCDKMSDRAPAV